MLKDTLAECVVNDVLSECSNATATNGSCSDVASPTHQGDPSATLHQRQKYAPREFLRIDGGKSCFKV